MTYRWHVRVTGELAAWRGVDARGITQVWAEELATGNAFCGSTPAPTPTPTPSPTDNVSPCAAGRAYKVNDHIQAHTSQPRWEPPNVPALWSRR